MFVKIAITGAVALVAFAATLYAVNKTANRRDEENAELPLEEQLTFEQLEDNLMGDFIQDVKAAKPTQFAALVLEDVTALVLKAYDYRVKAALVILALGAFPITCIAAPATGVAYVVLAQELVYQGVVHARVVWW